MIHPLDGLCAFLGALGFFGALVAAPVCAAFEWGHNELEKIYNKQHKSTYRYTVLVLCMTIALLAITIILASVN